MPSNWYDFNITAKFGNETVRVLHVNQKYYGMYWVVKFPDGTVNEKVKPSQLREWSWKNLAEKQNQETEKRRRGRPRKNK